MLIGLLALLTLLGTSSVWAESRRWVLAVGVSGYDGSALDRKGKRFNELGGPKNDVTLLVKTLLHRGVPRQQMRVLADQLDQSYYKPVIAPDGSPTLQQILAGFQWLADAADADDEVLIYLSGHGSYVPQKVADSTDAEDDGTDEIFLPSDVGTWDPSLETITNALTDNEIARRLAAVRASGAFVFFVADTCYSGTLNRTGVVHRGVDPFSGLQVPAAAVAKSAATTRGSLAGQVSGDMVAFYAAVPDMKALDVSLPLGVSDDQLRRHGLFTWYLLRALRSQRTSTYHDAALHILSGYWDWRIDAPRPMFEGGLHRPIFGGGMLGDREYAVLASGSRISIAGGLLDGVGKGFEIELHRIDAEDAPVTHATVVEAGADASLLGPLSGGLDVESRVRRNSAHYSARVHRRAFEFNFRVPASPPTTSASEAAVAQSYSEQLSALSQLPQRTHRAPFQIVAADAAADVQVLVQGNELLLTTGLDGKEVRLSRPSIRAETLNKVLGRLARAHNVLKVARELQLSPLARDLRVQIAIDRAGASAASSCPMHTVMDTVPASAVSADDAVRLPRRLSIGRCDRVYLQVTNGGRYAIDITPLYVAREASIDFLSGFTGSSVSGLRVQPGGSRVVSYTEQDQAASGDLLLLVTRAQAESAIVADFRYLATSSGESTRRSRSAPQEIRQLLHAAGVGTGASRSAMAPSKDTMATAFTVSF